MSKTTKRVLSWVLTVLMVVSMLSSFSVTVFAATSAFKDAYTCAVTDDNGDPVIGRDALLVSYSITEADKTTITRNWDGTDYTFVVGENAFSTLPKALDYAASENISTPDIIVTDTKGSNLNIPAACNLYAKNWNTLPYVRDTQDGEWKAVNSDGADWTLNSAYTDNQVKVNNVIVDGSITGELGVYGFTMIDRMYLNGIKNGNAGSDGVTTCANSRTDTTGKVEITFGNLLVDMQPASASTATTCFFMANSSASSPRNYWGNQSADCQDVVTFKNTYFKQTRYLDQENADVQSGKVRAQLFPDGAMPANMVFDGCYLDYEAAGFQNSTWFKQNDTVNNTSITFKNSNIRNITGDPSFIEFAGFKATNSWTANKESSKIILENNIYYNCKGSNSGVIFYRPATYSDIIIKDNYFENPYSFNGMGLISGDGTRTDIYPASSVENITVTGNKLLGFNAEDTVSASHYAVSGTAKVFAENNFLVKDNGKTNAEYQAAEGVALTVGNGLADGATGAFYYDYDMTMLSTELYLTDVKLGTESKAVISDDKIVVTAERYAVASAPVFTAKSKAASVKVSTKADFSDTVTEMDISDAGESTYYVRVYYDGYSAYKDYTMTVAVENNYAAQFENAYIINKGWTDDQLAGTDDLTVLFRGETRTVNPATHKLYNSWADASAAAYANLNTENYFTLNPIFVFAPGTYDETIELRAPSTVYGAQAGIDPNAQLPGDDSEYFEYIKTNSGLPANADRDSANESVFNGQIVYTTRVSGDYNDDGSMGFSGESAKWAYYKQKGYNANPNATAVIIVDGVKLDRADTKLSLTGHQPKNVTYNNETIAIKTSSTYKTNLVVMNVVDESAGKIFSAWNSTNERYTVDISNSRFTGAVTAFGERYVEDVNIDSSYLANFSGYGALTYAINDGTRYVDDLSKMTVTNSVLYNFVNTHSNGAFYLDANRQKTTGNKLELEMVGNVMYNVGNANYGDFRAQNTAKDNAVITFDIRDNVIYRDTKPNTFFNGNTGYVTKGKVDLIFTGNKVVSTNSSLFPNLNYENEDFKKLFYLDFSDNYWSTSVGGDAKAYVFNVPGEPLDGDGYSSNPNFNYNDIEYYLDWDLKYKSTQAAITAINVGEGNYTDISTLKLTANIFNKTGAITADSFTTTDNSTVKLYSGDDEITFIDLKTISGVQEYTVKVFVAGTEVCRTYILTVMDGAVDFNEALNNGGIKFGDKTFTAENTAAMAPEGQDFLANEYFQSYFYQYFNGVLYKFTVDNVNVFEYSAKNITYKQINGTDFTRWGLDLEKTKAVTENGNLILAGEKFNSPQFILTYPVSIYGLNAGINPVDKTNATAENNYAVTQNAEWGKHGETKINCTRVLADIDGTVTVDGITIADRVYDNARWGSTGTFNFEWKNIVYAGANGGNMFDLANPRTYNGCDANNANYLNDAEFGKTYNDSFVIENFYHRSGTTRHILNEQIPANVTIRNYYVDNSAVATQRNLIGFMKTGALNINSNITVEDCIFKNSAKGDGDKENGVSHRIFHSEGVRNAKSDVDYNISISINNNIFFKSAGVSYILVKPSLTDSLTITGNTFVAGNDTMTMYQGYGGAADIANINISNNRYVGFTDAQVNASDIDPDVTFADSYATTDVNAYKTPDAYTGYKATAFGDNDYYVNFGMTAKASEYALDIQPGTSSVTDITVDPDQREIQFSLARGTTEGILVNIAGTTATWYWSTDAEGTNKIDTISREDLNQLVSTYYFHIDVNGVVLTYRVEVLNDIVPDFADVTTFDPAYFSNSAVIITDKAANLADGTEIFEQWDGQWYRFYVGVNAFDTYGKAIALDDAVVELIIPEATTENGVLNDELDLHVTRSIKLFTPNYKTPAVLTDGYGNDSPSHGAAWRLNPEYVEKMDLVRIKTVSIRSAATVVETYGLTIDVGVYDRYKPLGTDCDIKLVNTYFTNDKPSDNTYMFSFSYNQKNNNVDSDGTDGLLGNEDNKSSLYVKNAYIAEVASGNRVRLIGENEMSVAHTTFDEIYLDAAASSGLGGNGNWLKSTAKDSSFTIKNSYLANWTQADFQFKGYYDTSTKGVAHLPDGYTNKLIFENNILYNFSGYNSVANRSAVFLVTSQSFSEITVKDNYIQPVYRTEARALFWDVSNKNNMTTVADVTVTGNVINGLKTQLTCDSGGNFPVNWNLDVSDNFVVTEPTNDLSNAIGRAYTTNSKYNTLKYDWYRLTADGSLKSCDIQDMTWSQRVAINGDTAIANIYDCDNVYIETDNGDGTYTYEFDLSSLLKENKYGNIVTVAYGDGEAVDLETEKLTFTLNGKIAADTAVRVTVTVDSPDGKADEETYTFVIFMNSGDAPAFDGNYVDDAGIISDNAVIITSAATTEGDTVNAQWMGETYSFVTGTNAFATVEDALAAAKTADLEYAEILLAESDATTDITITYPAKIYGVNYNTMPYITDGYGTASSSHGENWAVNTEYTDDQTHLDVITLDASFPTGGVLEINGVTIHGSYYDMERAAGNVADVSFKNIVMDLDGTVRSDSYSTKAKYVWILESEANLNTAGNSFTMTNVYVKSLGSNGGWIYGERTPETATFDGLWIPDMNSAVPGGDAYMKAGKTAGLNPVVTYKNSNFQNSTNGKTRLYPDGDDNTSKTKFVFDNNIFNNYYGLGTGYFMGGNVQRVSGIEITNNYIGASTPYKEMFYWGSLKVNGALAWSSDDLECDLIITGNVINGLANTTVSMGPSGVFPAENSIEFTVNGNYLVSAYDANITATNAVGEQFNIAQKHYDLGHVTKSNHYALDYDRTIMSNEIGDATVIDGTNILVDEDNKTVIYAYNDLVTKSESDAITVDLTAFTKLSNQYNSAVLVLSDDTEKDINTIFTYDGATLGETVTLKLYSYDKSVSQTLYAITFVEGEHAMGEWELYAQSGCGINRTDIRYCIADECTIAEGTCTHSETKEIEGTALPHQWPTSGYYNNDATCQADGTQTIYCEDCGEPTTIEAPGTKVNYHKYTEYVANDDGTCMVDGTMTAVCDWCNDKASTISNPDDTKEDNADDHEWGEYTYNNDATCLADGTQTRHCINEDAMGNVCDHVDETVAKEGTKVDHDWSDYIYNNDATCQSNGTETATCPGVSEVEGATVECGTTDTHEVEGTKLDHHAFEEDAYVLTTEATCTTPGYETAPCKYAYDGCTETDTRLNAENHPINPSNHDYAKPVYQEDATCTVDGTQTRKCKREGCGYVLTETAPGTAGQGTHIFGEYVANKDADCVNDGTMTAKCINDGCEATDTVTNPADPAGRKAHTWGEYTYNNDATCVKDGTKTATCTVEGCGATDTEKDTDHLKSTVAHNYTDWKSNNDATCTADGTKTRECQADRCYHTETVKDEGSMKPHTYGEYKYNGDATYLADGTKTAECTVCKVKNTVTATGTKIPPKTIIDTSSKFIDVNTGDWFKPAVDYAVTYGLISGVTETTFVPNGTITRGMFVTILARAAGVDTSAAANKAAKTQFKDVEAGRYYAAAVAWGASKQVVAGITTTEFAPDAPITREQLAVMIYRFAASQGITLKNKNATTFADAASVSSWAKDGVVACAAAGIVNGYNENGAVYFKPYKTATRAEATQMIYMFHSEYVTGTAK